MKYIVDLHVHSKYSRATSKNMDLENMHQWAQLKGIQLLATADFTHPEWFRELQKKLVLNDNGFFSLREEFILELPSQFKNSKALVNFILSTEISCIYSKGGKTRRIHVVVIAPNLEAAKKINTVLGKIGNLKADGRPILGLDAKKLAQIVLEASPDCLIIPAHIWTPWFSLFGSESGFDTFEECFEELTPYIYAVETGLSSDPKMNWRLSQLDRVVFVSNSDAHSLANLGREANVLESENLTYQEFLRIIRTKDKKSFLYTIEFFPEEGKYHFDGHRDCKIRFSPEETKKHKFICPQCKKKLTVGVMHRVDNLADRKVKNLDENDFIPYKSLIPLAEIMADVLGVGKNTKSVKREYDNLISRGKNEFNILLNLPREELKKITLPRIAEGIERVRSGQIEILSGYDGVYGEIKIFDKKEKESKQTKFF